MLITKGSSSLTHILPTGRLTPTLFSLFTLSSFLLRLYLCLSLFPGTTHSIGDPGGLRVRLCGLPRATVSRTNSLSPTGSTSIRFWCWAGGCGSCGVRDAPGKSLTVDHPLESPSGSLYVGECVLHVTAVDVIDENTFKKFGSFRSVSVTVCSNLSY